jgi:hypothetical protein
MSIRMTSGHARGLGHGRDAVAGLRHDLHVALSLEDHPEARADERLVVDEGDADAHRSPSAARIGSRARTEKPEPSGPASNVPPSIATRSRIPTSP